MKQTIDCQREQIVNYCKAHGSITIREAFTELNINSPSKRISELRHSPVYDVQQERECVVNSSGDKVYFVRYFIKEREVA